VDATGQLELFIAGRYAPYGFEAGDGGRQP